MCPEGAGGTEPRTCRVIAAFPATGKSYVAARVPGVLDSDSSAFSWKYRHPEVRERHPDWPGNYIAHLRHLLRSSARFVLVSTHAEVRNALLAEGIEFTLVYPFNGLRDEYRARMERRGSPAALIGKVVDELWFSALAECRAQRGCEHIELQAGEYLDAVVRVVEQQPPTEEPCGCRSRNECCAPGFPGCRRDELPETLAWVRSPERQPEAITSRSGTWTVEQVAGWLRWGPKVDEGLVLAFERRFGVPPGPPEPTQGNEWDPATVDDVVEALRKAAHEYTAPAYLWAAHFIENHPRFKGAARDTGGRSG